MVDAEFEFDDQLVSIPVTIDCRITANPFLPEPEQRYSCSGRFSITQMNRNPVFSGTDLQSESGLLDSGRVFGKLQLQIRNNLKMALPQRHAAIVTGFILGDTSGIGYEDRQLFKETGISHLLAISGQHLMILIVLLAAIFHWLKIPPISRSLLTAAILVVYAMTTSGSPSVWRALTMYLCISTVLHFEASPSAVRPVALAALMLLLYDPQNISNAAFILSFTAVLGIIYLCRPIESLFKRFYFPGNLSRYLAAALAANIATIPMTAFLFGTVSVVALLVNPMLLWVFSYILPISFLIVILATPFPSLALLLAPALTLLLDGMLIFLQKSASLPGHFFYAGNLSGITIAGFFALSLYALSLLNHREVSGNAAPLSEPALKADTADDARLLRTPEFTGTPSTAAIPARPPVESEKPAPPDYRVNNPFRDEKLVRAIDAMLLGCRRRPIKSSSDTGSDLLPLSMLSIDTQNLYHQLMDLDGSNLRKEPERLLQAHVYLLALVGNEIINRVCSHISPAPQPGDLRVEQVVRDRYLATSILADALLNSQLLTRANDADFMLLVSRAQAIYGRARNQLDRIVAGNNAAEALEQHLSLRRDLLCWCREFIEFDVETKRKTNTELRPEQ
jgi:ComEC/Rec2-related protein